MVAVDGGCGDDGGGDRAERAAGPPSLGPVLGVDAAGGQLGLMRSQRRGSGRGRTGGRPEPDGTGQRTAARTLRKPPPVCPVPPPAATCSTSPATTGVSASVADWTTKVSPIARFFDLVVTDWGVRPATVDLAGGGRRPATCVVMVGRADRRSATAAAAALAGPAGRRTPRLRPGWCWSTSREPPTGSPTRSAARWAACRSSVRPDGPHEPAAGRRFGSRTRRAHIALAVAVMRGAGRSQQPIDLRGGRAPGPAEVAT